VQAAAVAVVPAVDVADLAVVARTAAARAVVRIAAAQVAAADQEAVAMGDVVANGAKAPISSKTSWPSIA
jgi:molybdenum cofactor biosynthesis enzyme